MKKAITLVAIIFAWHYSFSQLYTLISETPTPDTIKKNEEIKKICFAADNCKMYQSRTVNKSAEKFDLKLSCFDIFTGALLKCDTIADIPVDFTPVADMAVKNDNVIISSNDMFISLNVNEPVKTLYSFPASLHLSDGHIKFKDCIFLNDSLALLYTAYNFHPADDSAGLHLHIFNMRQRKFIKNKFMKFPGVGLTHISGSWVTVVKKGIFVITPLSGKVWQLDNDLNIVGLDELDIFNAADRNFNIQYEQQLDSLINKESERIHAMKNKYLADTIHNLKPNYRSEIYSKDFISNTITEVKDRHAFINYIFPVEDSLIALCISKPGYKPNQRDLFFYDPAGNAIVKKYLQFNALPADTLCRVEDFLTLNITSGKARLPYFHDNIAYAGSVYSSSLYEDGNFNQLSEKIFNYVRKNGYVWSILKYRLE